MGKGSWIVRLALALAIVTGAAACGVSEQPLTKAQYRERVAQEIARQFPGSRIKRMGEASLIVTVPGERPTTQSLERSYAFYQDEPARLAEYVRGESAAFAPVKITPNALLVLVRPSASNPQGRGLVRPIAGDLIAIVAVDAPKAYQLLQGGELRAKLKMDDAAIWARALANTSAQIPYAPRPLKPGRPAEISAGNGLASSLLANDAFWDSEPLTKAGPVVVAAMARDNLYLAPLSDTKMVEALRKMMAKVADDPNTLSPDLLVRRNGHWEVLS
jgi:hypothetical protein